MFYFQRHRMELDATLDHIHEKQVSTFLKFNPHICPVPILDLHFGYNPVTVLYVISISDSQGGPSYRVRQLYGGADGKACYEIGLSSFQYLHKQTLDEF